ncbi:MAG: KH domain-containing protein [Firmicutes bacterium]|nr:KH domain-containing protein [Bacillota bacterium]
MLSLIETIAKALVDEPDQVSVRLVEENESDMVVELKVSEHDMGKVIGKQGRIAKALRTVVKAAATKQNKKVTVEIIS